MASFRADASWVLREKVRRRVAGEPCFFCVEGAPRNVKQLVGDERGEPISRRCFHVQSSPIQVRCGQGRDIPTPGLDGQHAVVFALFAGGSEDD